MGLVVAWEDISKSTEAVIILVLNRRFIILLLKRPISFVQCLFCNLFYHLLILPSFPEFNARRTVHKGNKVSHKEIR
jgi:hypothetical protein